jgi:hypothetical protein
MNSTKTILVSALAALGLAAGAAHAQHHGGGGTHSGGFSGHVSGGHVSGGHWSGGHWSGGHWGGWHGGWWGPRVGFYLGVPLFWGWPYYYGYPYYAYPYYDYAYGPSYYAPPVDGGGMAYPQGQVDSSTTQVQPGPGAPTQEPAYRNYCESAKAYYPKVTSCPEGWRFEPQPVR